MGSGNKKTDNQMSILELLKKSVLKQSAKDDSSSVFPETNNDVQSEPVKESEKMDSRHAIINVASDSLLFKLWHEWATAKAAQEEAEEKAAQEEETERKKLSESFEMILEQPDLPELPLSEMEVEVERRRATIQFMMRGKKHYQLTRADVNGNAPDVDAEMHIHVSQDRMAAWAFVFPPSGNGKPLGMPQVELTLQEYSVVSGISQRACSCLVEEQPYFKLILIACGTMPAVGKDGYIVEHFPRNLEVNYSVDDYGNIDYRNLNNIQIVHKGDVICESVPPVAGKDGMDVFGILLPAREGKEARLMGGRNTALNEEKNKLLAAADGQLRYVNGSFIVQPVMQVMGDVDLSVGNIDFIGDVRISGDVRDNFIIHATGSVYVDGLVEGAVIEAGKDVFIFQGILGDERAVIKAGGSVKTRYIEHSVVYAGDTVQAESIISSTIHSDNKIVVRGGRGTIIGGKLTAAYSIQAKVIGCRAERSTTLNVGERPCMQIHREELKTNLRNLEKEKGELERSLQFFARGDDEDSQRRQLIADIRLRSAVISMREQRLKQELEKFEGQALDLLKCEIKADSIYPTTVVRFQKHIKNIREKVDNIRLHVDIEKGTIELV